MKYVWNLDPIEFLAQFEPDPLTADWIFVSIPETKHGPPWHLHNGVEESMQVMEERQKQGFGCYWTVNKLDRKKDPGKHRTAQMFVHARAIWIDDDNPRGQPREDFTVEPSVVVETSPGRFHYYWIVLPEERERVEDSQMRAMQWKNLQASVLLHYGGDMASRDLSRCLRLPGSRNCKEFDTAPFSSLWLVKWARLAGAYTFRQLFDLLPNNFPPITDDRSAHETTDARLAKKQQDRFAEIAQSINYHDNLLALSVQFRRDGIAKDTTIAILESAMHVVPPDKRDERWKKRFLDIPRLVRDVPLQKQESAEILRPRLESLSTHVSQQELSQIDKPEIPWPPGQLGKLAQDALYMARYRHPEVAVISAIGLIAGIAGRKFNVFGTGLNLYLTLIMRSGMGKDSIRRFVVNSLMKLNDLGHASSYIGPVRFTGPKAVVDGLHIARSQVCVFTEAGILLKSNIGDPGGLTRMLLQLYTCSGAHDYSGKESYSASDASLPTLRAPALTIINEATPETLLEAFREQGALERGDIPRQSIFRVSVKKPYMSQEVIPCISDASLSRVGQLLKVCQEVQHTEDPQAVEMQFEPELLQDVYAYSDKLVDLENSLYFDDRVKSVMATRGLVKALKYAAIASVYNHAKTWIQPNEWAWAKALVDYELDGVGRFFEGSADDVLPVDDVIRTAIAPCIVKLLRGNYSASARFLTEHDRSHGIFTLVALRQTMRKNRAVTQFANRYNFGKDPFDILMRHMVNMHYLRELQQTSERVNATKRYQITRDFALIFDHELLDAL